MSARTWIVLGAVFGALAVGSGAFGAHGLKARLTESGQLDTYETAVRYQMYHALALVLVGLLALRHSSRLWDVAGVCFAGGILVFSGLLYGLALGGPRILGAIVPFGGLAFIVGWVAMAAGAWGLAQK
ncbi:MAG: DUF423 domain-containing protein [Planctomycetia bacterium]|nr:DUF423 domain-containing protein [Planctomycetia bacterium]